MAVHRSKSSSSGVTVLTVLLIMFASRTSAQENMEVSILKNGDTKVGSITGNEVVDYFFIVNMTEFDSDPYDVHIVLDHLYGDTDL